MTATFGGPDEPEGTGIIPAEGVGLLHISKNREGEIGCICFRHNESLTRITDYENTADAIGEAEPF